MTTRPFHSAQNKLPTIRRKLMVYILAYVVIAVMAFSVLTFYFFEKSRNELTNDTMQLVRAMGMAVDRDLLIAKNVLLALGTSQCLTSDDLESFYMQAKSLIGDDFPGFTFIVSDTTGKQLVNTLRNYGDPLPYHGNIEQLHRAVARRGPVISDVYIGGVLRRPVISIDTPILRSGTVRYVLSVGLLPARLGDTLTRQQLPKDRIAAIFDAKGVIVARTHLPDEFVGQQGAPALVERMREANEGVMEVVTLEGTPVITSFSRSALTGWTVAIGIPKAALVNEILQSVSFVSVAILVLFVAGFGAVWVVGGRIGQAVQALVKPVIALGSGTPLDAPPGEFQEAFEVTAALKTVEHELAQHREYLEKLVAERTAELTEANRTLDLLSKKDGLTGLANRRCFDEFLEAEWRRSARLGTPIALLMLDVDLFKAYNDTYGHQMGDECLRMIAAVLEENSRRAGELAARYGGEEFAVVLTLSDPKEAVELAEKLRQDVFSKAIPHALSPHGIVSVSIGVAALIPAAGQDAASLVGNADRALYRAKSEGRNVVIGLDCEAQYMMSC